MPIVALLDANVLYPPYLRDLLLRLAQAGVYQPRWSAEILDEVARNVKERRDAAGQTKVDQPSSLPAHEPGVELRPVVADPAVREVMLRHPFGPSTP